MARSSHSDTEVKWYDMRDGYTDTATICPWIRKEKKISKKNGITKESVTFTWALPYDHIIIFDEEH
jgi:hypothetical protein